MAESDYARKHSLLCLRLAAECRDLAAAAPRRRLRARALGWPTCGRNPQISFREGRDGSKPMSFAPLRAFVRCQA